MDHYIECSMLIVHFNWHVDIKWRNKLIGLIIGLKEKKWLWYDIIHVRHFIVVVWEFLLSYIKTASLDIFLCDVDGLFHLNFLFFLNVIFSIAVMTAMMQNHCSLQLILLTGERTDLSYLIAVFINNSQFDFEISFAVSSSGSYLYRQCSYIVHD